jgi:transposase
MLIQEKNRLEKATNDSIISKISTSISFIQASLDEIESEIDHFIDAGPTLKAKKGTLTSVKGVAKQTANILIAELPELGKINKNKSSTLSKCCSYQ